MSVPNPINPTFTQLIGDASGVVTGQNETTYTRATFLEDHPQFSGLITEAMLDQFVGMANASVKEAVWGEAWRPAMGWFIAHFSTLYLQTSKASEYPTAATVIGAAQSRGLVNSKSVGDLSVSYDFATMTKGIEGWAVWNATTFGQQYATMGRLIGKTGMYVW